MGTSLSEYSTEVNHDKKERIRQINTKAQLRGFQEGDIGACRKRRRQCNHQRSWGRMNHCCITWAERPSRYKASVKQSSSLQREIRISNGSWHNRQVVRAAHQQHREATDQAVSAASWQKKGRYGTPRLVAEMAENRNTLNRKTIGKSLGVRAGFQSC